jgi:hypothetical protein
MNNTTEIIYDKKFLFPTKCKGVGRGHGYKTIIVDVCLATQVCRDWETLEEKRMYVFSASAHAPRMWGQCLDYIHENIEQFMVPDALKELYKRIYEVWTEYHLNDLQSGTKIQTEALTKELHRADHYTEACKYLASIGLFEDRGYKYGHGWLCREIPAEVIEEILTWRYADKEDERNVG